MKAIYISILLTILLITNGVTGLAQIDDKGGFKKERIYIGSALNLGVSGNAFQIGANPEIGYSITKWLDAGISFNILYSSYRYSGYSNQLFNYGGGAVVRIWPFDFLFISSVSFFSFLMLYNNSECCVSNSSKNSFSNLFRFSKGISSNIPEVAE